MAIAALNLHGCNSEIAVKQNDGKETIVSMEDMYETVAEHVQEAVGKVQRVVDGEDEVEYETLADAPAEATPTEVTEKSKSTVGKKFSYGTVAVLALVAVLYIVMILVNAFSPVGLLKEAKCQFWRSGEFAAHCLNPVTAAPWFMAHFDKDDVEAITAITDVYTEMNTAANQA
jgi:hypothetical protein